MLAAAVRDHERVRFAYTARDAADSRRDVEPHSLVNAGRRWYLVAWDRDRSDWRTFRVDRIANPQSSGVRFTPRELPTPDAAAFVQRSLRSYPLRHEARLTIQAPAEEIATRRWLGGDVTELEAGGCELRISDDNLDWLAMRIAMIPWPYTVHEPPELVERLRTVAQGITQATQSSRTDRRRSRAPDIASRIGPSSKRSTSSAMKPSITRRLAGPSASPRERR